MTAAAWTMTDQHRWTRTLRLGRLGRILGRRTGRIQRLPWPLSAWTRTRDAPRPPQQTFRDWWTSGGGPA